MKQMKNAIIATALLIVIVGCSITEDERCADGYQWDDEYMMCLRIQPKDTEPLEIDTEPQPNGVGTVCASDESCVELDLDVNYCLEDPTNPAAGGICSVMDCDPSDCTGPYSCCDCTAAQTDMVNKEAPFCLPLDFVALVQAFGCICE